MIHGSCHCRAIRLAVPSQPEHLIDCNCSICRRHGALWSLYECNAVNISGRLNLLTPYVWGRRSIRIMHCSTCGCVTHWEPIGTQDQPKMGINMRNFDQLVMRDIKVRRFDGADSWAYLD